MQQTVFLFSGQGSHYLHMGKRMFDENAVFRHWMVSLNRTAQRHGDFSVLDALYPPEKVGGAPFDRTRVTHPAIFMVEYSLAQALIHAGVQPDSTLGVSVGSFAAAAVAGLIDAHDALIAVMGQAAALERSCEPGGMLAVLGDPRLFAEPFLAECCALAAVNFKSHFVVSGRVAGLAAVERELLSRRVTFQRLPVSYAFHSQWIDGARREFLPYLRALTSGKGKMPMMCCERAAELSELPDEYFWQTARQPMRFRESAQRLEQGGFRRYIDVGPAGTLATLLKYILPPKSQSSIHSILTPFGRDLVNFSALTGSSS